MSIKNFTLILATAAGLGSGAAAQEDPIVLRFSHFLGPDSFFQEDVVGPWARELEARTDGRVEVETFAADTPYGRPTAQATQVAEGEMDIALGLRGAEGERFPGTSVVELPFLISDAKSGSLALWDLYADGPLAEEYEDFHVLALFVHDPGLVHTTERRVERPEDMAGLRLRSPNATVSAALEHLGAEPVVLQVDEVMDAVRDGRVEGIVTNWGNPLQGFNDHMKRHADLRFYTSAFFIVMNEDRYAGLPEEVRTAIDEMSGVVLVERLGDLWAEWAMPVHAGAEGSDHDVVQPDREAMAAWREALDPVTERYLDELAAGGFDEAHAAYERLAETLRD